MAILSSPNIIIYYYSRSSLEHPIFFPVVAGLYCLLNVWFGGWQLEIALVIAFSSSFPIIMFSVTLIFCMVCQREVRFASYHFQIVTLWVLALLDDHSSLFELQPFACRSMPKQVRNPNWKFYLYKWCFLHNKFSIHTCIWLVCLVNIKGVFLFVK